MLLSEVKWKEKIIATTVQASSVGLFVDSLNALASVWKAVYPIYSTGNIAFLMFVEEQELGYGEQLAASLAFVLLNPPHINSYV